MKTLLSKIIFAAACFAAVSCADDSVLTVDVAKNMDMTDTVGLEGIVSDVRVVELKGEGLYNILIFGEYDGKLYGKTANDVMVIFSEDGELLKSYKGKGRGPGEYATPSFDFDYVNGEILVLDMWNKVLRFDEDGNLLAEVKTPAVMKSGDIIAAEEDRYISTVMSNVEKDSSLIYLDADFNETGKEFPVFNNAQLSDQGLLVAESLDNFNSSVMYRPFGEDVFYRYSDGDWTPYLRIDEGRYRMPAELLTSMNDDAKSGYLMGYRRNLAGKYLFYSYMIVGQMAIYFDIFDIETGVRLAHNIYTEEDMGNGIDEGYRFSFDGQAYRALPQYVKDNVLYWSRFDDDGNTILYRITLK